MLIWKAVCGIKALPLLIGFTVGQGALNTLIQVKFLEEDREKKTLFIHIRIWWFIKWQISTCLDFLYLNPTKEGGKITPVWKHCWEQGKSCSGGKAGEKLDSAELVSELELAPEAVRADISAGLLQIRIHFLNWLRNCCIMKIQLCT